MESRSAWWAGVSLAAALTLVLAGCETEGHFIPEDHRFVALPPTATVVIYSPAGRGEQEPDICAGAQGLLPLVFLPGAAGGVPDAIRDLPGAGAEDLIVYADCSYARGHPGAAELETVRPQPCFARGVESMPGYLLLKTCRRVDDLERLVQEVHRNLPADRIFVAGSGIGGWAALLAARDPFRKFNAAIAIDPVITSDAIAGNDTWSKAIDRHLAYLTAAPPSSSAELPPAPLPALVFLSPQLGPSRLADLATAAPDFERVHAPASAAAIAAYIACRLATPQAPCAPAGGSS
jgi:pimeloyl-ACP methyl ester carboxylesterase